MRASSPTDLLGVLDEITVPMIGVALRGLARRKLRSALTAIAIILGVAMVSGTYVLTDTIDKAFNQIFQDSYANADAVVTGKGQEINFEGSQSLAPPVDASLLDKIPGPTGRRGGDRVGLDQTATKIIGEDGKAINLKDGAPSFGIGVDPSRRSSTRQARRGKWPQASDEVVLDASTADEQGFKIDTVKIATLQPVQDLAGRPRELRRRRLARHRHVHGLRPPDRAEAPRPRGPVRRDLGRGRERRLARAAGEADHDRPAGECRIPHRRRAGGQGSRAGRVHEVHPLHFLLSFAGIALFVGAFVIFNTLSITVAQRT